MGPFGWALAAAACWGIAPLFEKVGLTGRVEPMVAVAVRSAGVIVGLLGLMLCLPQLVSDVKTLPLRSVFFLICGGLLASIAGQLCFYRALKLGDVSRVVPVGASYPVLACLLGVLLLHEAMTPTKFLGIVLVVAGTYLLR